MPSGQSDHSQRNHRLIAEQADGDHIIVSLESVDKGTKLTDEQKKAVGNKPVYDVTIASGDKQISTFNGGKVTIALPYILKEGETVGVVKSENEDAAEAKKVDDLIAKISDTVTLAEQSED